MILWNQMMRAIGTRIITTSHENHAKTSGGCVELECSHLSTIYKI